MARAFTHPSPKDFTIDGILHALSDPIRRNIVAKLLKQEGMNCGKACDSGKDCDKLSPSTISFHYKVLRESGLIRSQKVGVEVISTVRCEEVNKRFPGLLESILKFHAPTKAL